MKRILLAGIMLAALCGCQGSAKLKNGQMNADDRSKTVEWAHNTNIYEVNVRQFTPEGTFRAVEPHLSRLKEMGIRTLWFMPITPIAQKNKKGSLGSQYATSDYTGINPEFGTLEDFKHLVKTAQGQGFKVIIDWVANHTGWDHKWTFLHPEYYEKDSAGGGFRPASGMDDIIELDFQNPELRKAMIEAMKYWVKECDIDGFRCDLAAWVEVDFWREARPEVEKLKKLFWLGEFDEIEKPEYGHVFDASYAWKWMHTTREFYHNQLPLAVLDTLLTQYAALGDRSMRAWFTSNHDENTWNGTEYEKYGDMAGALAVFSATWNGVPLIYNGQELPMTDKRLEFFEKDPIPWTGTYALQAFYKTLLNLHADHPALRGGDPGVTTHRPIQNAPDKVMAYLRSNGERQVLVILNLSRDAVSLRFDDEALSGSFRNVFDGGQQQIARDAAFELKAWEYLVFEK